MSMENAILELAAAMRENTAALIKAAEATAHSTEAYRASMAAYASVDAVKAGPTASPARQAIQKALDDAKAGRKGNADDATEVAVAAGADDKKAQILQAAEASGVADVVRAVSAEIEAKGTVDADSEKARIDADTKAAEADRTEVQLDAEAAPLDYAKDVRPVLLAAIKKGKRAEIEAHLAAAGVKKADELPAEKLPALLDMANKLAA